MIDHKTFSVMTEFVDVVLEFFDLGFPRGHLTTLWTDERGFKPVESRVRLLRTARRHALAARLASELETGRESHVTLQGVFSAQYLAFMTSSRCVDQFFGGELAACWSFGIGFLEFDRQACDIWLDFFYGQAPRYNSLTQLEYIQHLARIVANMYEAAFETR